jgi:hypothetical protein
MAMTGLMKSPPPPEPETNALFGLKNDSTHNLAVYCGFS